jgi:dienelactone hydrolase
VRFVTFDRTEPHYAGGMAVLKGEGRVSILFGSWALPVPPNRSAYIARPDESGTHPTVVVAHDESGITPGVKAIARHLARYGYSVIVPDLSRGQQAADGFEWVVSDVADAVDSTRIPGVEWASDVQLMVLGIGTGAVPAAIVAIEEELSDLVLVDGSLDADLLQSFGGALTVLQGGSDERVTPDELKELHSAMGRGEWIVYPSAGEGFFDEGAPGFDSGAAADALIRVVAIADRLSGATVSD